MRDHPGLARYGIESYIAVPLHRRNGSYFGTLCALDPLPTELDVRAFDLFHMLAQLIAFELEADERQRQRDSELRTLEDVIAIAGHDLRQPLTTLYARAQLLERRARRGIATDDLLAQVASLAMHTKRALQLSETLLDLAQFQAGSFRLQLAQFDLIAVLRELLDDARTAAQTQQFVLRAPPTLLIMADERRLEQVLRNLLDNAVKYGHSDAQPIEMIVSFEPQASPSVVIEVRDHGVGVPEDELPFLFTRHYRASTGKSVSGTGLGLYIAQQIVAAHGGTIRAAQALGGGLLVQVTLPLAPAAPPESPTG